MSEEFVDAAEAERLKSAQTVLGIADMEAGQPPEVAAARLAEQRAADPVARRVAAAQEPVDMSLYQENPQPAPVLQEVPQPAPVVQERSGAQIAAEQRALAEARPASADHVEMPAPVGMPAAIAEHQQSNGQAVSKVATIDLGGDLFDLVSEIAAGYYLEIMDLQSQLPEGKDTKDYTPAESARTMMILAQMLEAIVTDEHIPGMRARLKEKSNPVGLPALSEAVMDAFGRVAGGLGKEG